MNKSPNITPTNALKLSAEQVKTLLKYRQLVKADNPKVKKWIALDETIDKKSQMPIFYPYHNLLTTNGCPYWVHDEKVENMQEEIWQQFESFAVNISHHLAKNFENRLDLEMPAAKMGMIEKDGENIKAKLTNSNLVNLEGENILESLQKLIRKFVIDNLEHAIQLWMQNSPHLDESLVPFASLLADYYFLQYLKWKSSKEIQDARALGIPYYEILESIIKTKKGSVNTSFNVKKPDRINQRELIFLMKLANKKLTFPIDISTTQEVQYQFVGIISGFKPVSFATEASRTINYGENQMDRKYLESLVAKLSDPDLSKSSQATFKSIVQEIKTVLKSNKF